MAIAFSVQLRRETRDDHRRAESAPYAQVLIAGRLTRAGFAALVAQHYAIYTELEEVTAAMAADPVVGPLAAPELNRLPALAADLAALFGPRWRDRLDPVPATERYQARIRTVAGDPVRFVAHHYVRYLGDLSGGQILRRTLHRAGIAEPGNGADFYVFDAIPDARRFKIRYRELLDGLPWDTADRAAAVAEARLAFQLNTAVFEDLGRDLVTHLRPTESRELVHSCHTRWRVS